MKIDVPYVLLLLSFCFYFAGICLIRQDDSNVKGNVIHQESVVYMDRDGEIQEDEGLIEIEGIGRVLSYLDIYLCTIPFLIVSCILGRVIFNSTDEVRFMIYTNCIIGLLLIWLTTKTNAISTILYWCGIITASYIHKKENNYE